MERESRLKIGCALMTCLTIPLMLCAAAVVFGPGLNLNGVSLPGARASAPAVDRLAVIGEDGNVYVLDRSGQSRVALTTNAALAQSAAVRRLYAFPNWSPDSEQVAFVGLSSENGGKASLFAAGIKDVRSETQPLELYSSEDNFPFFLFWSPNSKRVAFLAQNDQEMSLNTANADGSGTQELGKGAPFYISWSPDSQSLVSHVGGSRRQSADAFIGLHSLTTLGQPQHLSIAPGNFLAPAWSPAGNEILMALASPDNRSDTLVVSDSRGEQTRTLAQYAGNVGFAWSRDGKHIAYLITQQTSAGLKSELHMVNADGSHELLIADDSPVAFFWSPDSAKIAMLTRASGGQGGLVFTGDNRQQAQLRLTWKVVTVADNKVSSLVTFVPTDAFASLLPYFDQYAQSLQIWSPDSQAVVYAAQENDGTEAIYVADTSRGEQARRLTTGSIGVWSYR